jgi:hypothetical protein
MIANSPEKSANYLVAGVDAGTETTHLRRLHAIGARWRSGDVEDCKSSHPGSIPGRASSEFPCNPALPRCADASEQHQITGLSPISAVVRPPAAIRTHAVRYQRGGGSRSSQTFAINPVLAALNARSSIEYRRRRGCLWLRTAPRARRRL